MRALKLALGLLLMLAVGAAALLGMARFSDGPLEIIAGGPLTGGELVSGPEPDWSWIREVTTVEFQLLEPPRSRTTWILEHDGRIFIPCGYMNSTWGRIWKRWPIEAEQDGRAILRVDGKRYSRQLVRVRDPDLASFLVAELNRKYGSKATAETVAAGSLWLFELTPRDHSSD